MVNNQLSISKIPIPRESIISGECARLCAIGAEICEVLTTYLKKQSQFPRGSKWQRHIGTEFDRIALARSLCASVPQCLCGCESIWKNKANLRNGKWTELIIWQRITTNMPCRRLEKTKPISQSTTDAGKFSAVLRSLAIEARYATM